MACSCCGGRIRRLAAQYPNKNVPAFTGETIAERKAALAAAMKYSVVIEEVDSKYTDKLEDLSTIHTE